MSQRVVLLVVALVVALCGIGATAASAQTTIPQQIGAVSTTDPTGAQKVFNLLDQQVGSTNNANAAMAGRAKVDMYGLNALRTSAKPAAQEAAKVLTKRAIAATLLPRAAAFLGPAGLSAFAAYELCNQVFGCFKSTVQKGPPTDAAGLYAENYVYRYEVAGDGVVHLYRSAFGQQGDGTDMGTVSAAATPSKVPAIMSQADGSEFLQYRVGTTPQSNGGYLVRDAAYPTGTLASGVTAQQSSANPYSSGGLWWIAFRPMTDTGSDVARTGTSCTLSGSNCGTFPTPSDAVAGAGLRAKIIANNDVNLSKYVARQVDSSNADPYNPTTTVPSVGPNETATSYVGRLQSAGLGFIRTVVSVDAADLTKPAGAVLDINPAGGTVVDNGATIQIRENPDPMPVKVLAPSAGETYSSYLARLRAAGLTGTVTRVDRTDATLDASKGPNAVLRATPAFGTTVAPDAGLRVETNPETAPDAGTGTSTGTTPGNEPGAPAPNTIDLGPINIPTPCSKFPFGVPCWTLDWLRKWSTVGSAPVIDLPVYKAWGLHLDLGILNPVMAVLRIIELAGGTILMGWMFARLAGVGGTA